MKKILSMVLNCPEIALAINYANEAGNNVQEVSEGWTNAKKVFHMQNKLNADLKEKIGNEIGQLEYWKDKGAPHYPPSEGFFCNQCKIGITFPIK